MFDYFSEARQKRSYCKTAAVLTHSDKGTATVCLVLELVAVERWLP